MQSWDEEVVFGPPGIPTPPREIDGRTWALLESKLEAMEFKTELAPFPPPLPKMLETKEAIEEAGPSLWELKAEEKELKAAVDPVPVGRAEARDESWLAREVAVAPGLVEEGSLTMLGPPMEIVLRGWVARDEACCRIEETKDWRELPTELGMADWLNNEEAALEIPLAREVGFPAVMVKDWNEKARTKSVYVREDGSVSCEAETHLEGPKRSMSIEKRQSWRPKMQTEA